MARDSLTTAWAEDQYRLLDFGRGRKLERFGSLVLDRPCPAAVGFEVGDASLWSQADLRLTDADAAEAEVQRSAKYSGDWRVAYGSIQFQLRVTPFGHVGLFPEHAAQWDWLVSRFDHELPLKPPSVLNLFAYTGGASLVLASHGWHVTHVDAAESTVQWARLNANLSGLADAPIRWLVEDARVYVARELKRGRRYDAILLDPPSYGHGPKGKAWQIERDLQGLLEQCCQLLSPHGVIVLSGHSDPVPVQPQQLVNLRQSCGHQQVTAEFSRVTLQDIHHRHLDFGWCLRAVSKW